ncbi:metallophosphoesterase [Liberiplasma polymorphum]|uniref:metallophosphoesterase n=1 Tax=Liberiplasma polymorphum TaxID=3374570 RepID=UPI003773F1C4
MIKKIILTSLFFMLFVLTSCMNTLDPLYTDNEPIIIEMKNNDLKILQLTDLHLTYGIDYNDRQTYKAIEDLVLADDWDLVIFTGDIVMSPLAVPLFRHLVNLMESLEVPWTFILGNHDRDYHSAARLLSVIENTHYLKFKTGPELEGGGVGNFKITFTKDDQPFYHLYFLDTKIETNHPDRTSKYDFLSEAQVNWYEDFVSNDTVPNSVFMHTPLIQFELVNNYIGTFGEPVHPQGLDTGFVDKAVIYGLTQGIFVGHDHDNDFSFIHEGIMLAYGRYTGYNAYGFLELGGRVIHIDETQSMTSWIITLSKVRP